VWDVAQRREQVCGHRRALRRTHHAASLPLRSNFCGAGPAHHEVGSSTVTSSGSQLAVDESHYRIYGQVLPCVEAS
jgi:hypothetical protein